MDEIIAQKKDVRCVNVFEFVGSVVHKYRPNPDVIILTVALKGRDIHEADYPNVAFYGKETADSVDASIKVEKDNYPRVRISGSVQTNRKIINGKPTYYQNFIGNSIKLASNTMEALSGVRGLGKKKAESQNDVCLMGEVYNVYMITREGRDRPLGAILTLRCHTDHVNYPRVSCFGRMTTIASGLQRGDVVCVTGFAETQFKDGDEHRIRLESIIANEIETA